MNEVTTFCDGECPDSDNSQSRKLAEDIGSDSDWFFGYAD